MKLEDQCVGLPLAKRLKELGVKQEGLFYWKYSNGSLERKSGIKISTELKFGTTPKFQNAGTWLACSAFTVSELGEMLPTAIFDEEFLSFDKVSSDPDGENFTGWFCGYSKIAVYSKRESAPTIVDAAAKMLIHLIEKGLVKP